jgi:hypothetical protein
MKTLTCSLHVLITAVLLFSARPVQAQQIPDSAITTTGTYAVTAATPVRVTRVTNLAAGHEHELRVGDRIRLDVSNLEALTSQNSDTASLLLFINGVPMTDVKATYACDSAVFFHLVRSGNTDPWDVFYTSPFVWTNNDVRVSIGYYNSCAVPSDAVSNLIIIRKWYFAVALMLIIVLILLFYYGIKNGMLKDDSTLPPAERPYSLGRSQLAFWTFIISVSYIFIALVTGELAPLSTSTLILLGISGLTTAVAGTIDNSDKQNNNTRQQDVYKTDSFVNDILSDPKGVSVHRLQMVIFTLILGLFFIRQVFTTLQMPDFDNNLLTLMGLSSITYTGLKATENRNNGLTSTGVINNSQVPPPVDNPPPAV